MNIAPSRIKQKKPGERNMTQVLYCGSLVVCGTYLYNLVSSITISQYPSLKTLRIYLFLVSHLLHILVLLPEILPSYPFTFA